MNSSVVPSNILDADELLEGHAIANTNTSCPPTLFVGSPLYSEGCKDGKLEGTWLGSDEGSELGCDEIVGDEDGR